MKINEFITKYYTASVELKEKFKITEEKEWNGLTVLNELQVQIGHVAHIISDNKSFGEKGRHISDIGDEISDVILQLFSYSTKVRIDLRNLEFCEELNDDTISSNMMNLLIVIGKLAEITLENEKYRHYKIRYGFPEIKNYLISLFNEFFQIIFSIIKYLNLNIDEEYEKMLKDANKFLDRYKANEDRIYYPIVDMHATWLVLNPIQGCPKKCKYCFLDKNKLNGIQPIVLVSPKEAIQELLQSKLYIPDIPLCLFSQTDAFSTKENIEYLKQLIYLIDKNDINNPIIFISKCDIQKSFIEYLKQYIKKGHKFIFLLSYSGLESDIEQGVIKKQIENNFIKLKNNGINVIHYWRPFLPQNSTKEKINEIYDFVKKYADASVVIGLKTTDSIINNLNWKELSDVRETAKESDNVWPKETYNYVWNELKHKSDYPMYQTTSCALALVLNKPERKFFYGTHICKNCNLCPDVQRKICKDGMEKKQKITKEHIQKILKRLNINIENKNIEIRNNILYLKNKELKRTEISIITELLGIKTIAVSSKDDYYWNTSINNKEILKI